eukprot:GFUD01062839.1.p1 GENE.GFUD01062839.1~~GFUD01062839.1.p1  ORF type:complete len:198 (-),score=52.88 GFUD01062839.1:341-934(-)
MSKGKQEKGSGEAKEPVKVYKWDGTAVKNALDDAVKEVMTAKLPYMESFNLMDGRLVICAVAVGVAMFALLWDFLNPFPRSRPVLIGCVASYFLLMGVLTLYTTFKEKGIFVVVRQKDPAGLDPDSTWEAASNMTKYDDVYELKLTYTEGKTSATRETTITKSVGDVIDENGLVCRDIIEPLVMKLHNSLASGKKDK